MTTPLVTHSVPEVAAMLGCSERFLRDLLRARDVPCLRTGRRFRFTEAHVEQIVAFLTQPAEVTEPSLVGARSRGRRAS